MSENLPMMLSVTISEGDREQIKAALKWAKIDGMREAANIARRFRARIPDVGAVAYEIECAAVEIENSASDTSKNINNKTSDDEHGRHQSTSQ